MIQLRSLGMKNKMIPLVAIGLITIVVASLVMISSSIDNQQELVEINIIQYEKQNEIAAETNNIKAIKTDGTIEFSNTSNQQINVIQIRVYDDGNYVESFDVDEIILGNTELEITDLPAELQVMLRDE